MNNAPLSLTRVLLDSQALATFAARHKLMDDDLGYALHVVMRRVLGKAGPQPFRRVSDTNLDGSRNIITLLAYTRNVASLDSAIRSTVAEVDVKEVETISRIFIQPPESRPMPKDWSAIRELDFEVLIRPVRRLGAKARSKRQEKGEKWSGGERDAFLSAVEASATGHSNLDRESTYVRWLVERLHPAAEIVDGYCRMEQFRRTRLRRSSHYKNRTSFVEGPEALMKGRLRITNPDAFDRMLASGVGRHTAFGFGMLLLSPPRDS